MRIHERLLLDASNSTDVPKLVLESGHPTSMPTCSVRTVIVQALVGARTHARTLYERRKSEIDELYSAAAEEDMEATAEYAYRVSISFLRHSIGPRERDIQAH
jgi:hypothetical protein